MPHLDKSLDSLADQVIEQLQGKVIIHRYDSFTTNSIYLKFDYGVANSLRISDHPGKQYLKYRFNLMNRQAGTPHYQILREGLVMHFYPPEELDNLVQEILRAKQEKINYYPRYDAVIAKAKFERNRTRGFWRCARRIA